MRSCNAKNHRANCPCGFGGANQSAFADKTHEEAADLFSLPRVPRHYTKQNERCSYCNAPVFFHRLSNGGRAYFDKIGAPWLKHPCTDTASPTYFGAFGADDGGWPQLTQPSVDVLSDSVLRLSGKLKDQDCLIFVSKSTFKKSSSPSTFLSESYIQARLSPSGRFNLALLTPELKHMLLTGYVTEAEAESKQA